MFAHMKADGAADFTEQCIAHAVADEAAYLAEHLVLASTRRCCLVSACGGRFVRGFPRQRAAAGRTSLTRLIRIPAAQMSMPGRPMRLLGRRQEQPPRRYL